MVAKTFKGLEEVLADELSALGAEDVQIGQRMVAFKGDLRLMYSANLCCRTALRILKPIFQFAADTPDQLYDAVREIEWETLMTPDSTFSIDSTVNSSEFTHSKFVTYRVKDGIADHFNDRYGRRPSVRLSGADVQLNVHILNDEVTISLDSSGEPLSRRGYRQHQTEAPINEVLAAGIILSTGWRGDTPFADPMCGSGTFLIEAAMIAANVNPGIYRKNFAFETWKDFDAELFEELYNDDSNERPIANMIYGGDIDSEAVAIARQNIKAAGFESNIELACKDFSDWKADEPEGIIVTNPPYGERLRPADIENLYHSIGTTLKNNFAGWHAWILGYRKEHFDAIGMKASMKIPLLNGALECSLREYVMFDGKFSDFRASGGSLSSRDANEATSKYERVKRDRKEFKKAEHEDGRRSGKTDRYRDKDHNKGFRNDTRKDAKKEFRKDFDKDFDKDFKRNSKRDFKTKRHDRSESDKREAKFLTGELKKINNRGPRISEEKTTIVNKVHMRRRKNKNINSED